LFRIGFDESISKKLCEKGSVETNCEDIKGNIQQISRLLFFDFALIPIKYSGIFGE
jgi:hypothetical protein